MHFRMFRDFMIKFCFIQLVVDAAHGCGPVKADIVLLIDESGSIGKRNFPKQLDFLSSLIDTLPIGSDAVRIGAVKFSDDPDFVFGLDSYTNSGDIKTAINNIDYNRGGTQIVKGIEYIRYTIFTEAYGDRPDVQNYILLITDGLQDEAGSAGQAATAAGITIFVVGIGSEVAPNKDKLVQIVSPNDHYFFFAEDFDDLTSITLDVAAVLPCPYYCGNWSVGYEDPLSSSDIEHPVSDQMFLLYDDVYDISCCAVISGWEFYASVAGEVEFVVWRQNGSTFDVVGSNKIQINESDISKVMNFTVPDGERIAIISGDRIGWFCNGRNIIPYSSCNVSQNEDCPQSTLMADSRGSLVPGTTFDWTSVLGTNNVSSDRSYALKFYTSNNTAPSLSLWSSVESLPDSSPIGTVVLTFNISDPDKADVITYNISSDYFTINENLGVIEVARALPSDGSLSNTTLTLTATDSCYNTVTLSIRLSVYSMVPVIRNLPRGVSVPHLSGGRATLHQIEVLDTSIDSVCCTLHEVRPPSNHFYLFKNSSGFFVNTSTTAYFDHTRANSYRLTICCGDGTTTTRGILQVDVRRPRTTQESPGWVSISLSLSMMPILTACSLAIMLLIATL